MPISFSGFATIETPNATPEQAGREAYLGARQQAAAAQERSFLSNIAGGIGNLVGDVFSIPKRAANLTWDVVTGDVGPLQAFERAADWSLGAAGDLAQFAVDVVRDIPRSFVSIAAEGLDELTERIGYDLVKDGQPLGLNNGWFGRLLLGEDDLYTVADQFVRDKRQAELIGASPLEQHIFASGFAAFTVLDAFIFGKAATLIPKLVLRKGVNKSIQKQLRDLSFTDNILNTEIQKATTVIDNFVAANSSNQVSAILQSPEISRLVPVEEMAQLAQDLAGATTRQEVTKRLYQSQIRFLTDNTVSQINRNIKERGHVNLPENLVGRNLNEQQIIDNALLLKSETDAFIGKIAASNTALPKELSGFYNQAAQFDNFDAYLKSINDNGGLGQYVNARTGYAARFDRIARKGLLETEIKGRARKEVARKTRMNIEDNKVVLRTGNTAFNNLTILGFLEGIGAKGFKSLVKESRKKVAAAQGQYTRLMNLGETVKAKGLAKGVEKELYILKLNDIISTEFKNNNHWKYIYANKGNLAPMWREYASRGDNALASIRQQQQNLIDLQNTDGLADSVRKSFAAYDTSKIQTYNAFRSLPGKTNEEKLKYIWNEAQKGVELGRNMLAEDGVKPLVGLYQNPRVLRAAKFPYELAGKALNKLTPGSGRRASKQQIGASNLSGSFRTVFENKYHNLEQLSKKVILGAKNITKEQLAIILEPMERLFVVDTKKAQALVTAQDEFVKEIDIIDEVAAPLRAKMSAQDARTDLGAYLVATRLPEYRKITGKNTNFSVKYKGAEQPLTNREAERIIDEIEAVVSKDEIARLQKAVKEYQNETARILHAAGIIDDVELTRWIEDESYVAFERRLKEKLGTQLDEIDTKEINVPIFGVRKAGVAEIKGSDLSLINPLESLIGRRQLAIERAAENEFRQSLARSFDTMLEIKDEVTDGLKNVVRRVDRDELRKAKAINPERTFTYFENGIEKGFAVSKEMAETLMPAVTVPASTSGAMLFGLLAVNGQVTRFLKNTFTTYMPTFGPRAFGREIFEMQANVAAIAGIQTSANAFGELPRALATTTQYHGQKVANIPFLKPGTNTKVNKEYLDYYQEFLDGGGLGGIVGSRIARDRTESEIVFRSFDEITSRKDNRFQRMIASAEDRAENWNFIYELSPRFATYVAARKEGYRKTAAQRLAKEATVNFQKRGTASPYLNSMYSFYTSSVNGNVRNISTLLTGRGALSIGARQLAATEFFNTQNDLIDPEWRGKVSEYVRESNHVMIDGDGNAVTIPVPHGDRVFKAIFDALYDQRHGHISMEQGIDRVTGVFAGNYNPVGGHDLLSSVMPTTADPIVDTIRNESFFGGEITPKGAAAYENSMFPWEKEPGVFKIPGIRKAADLLDIKPGDVKYLQDQYLGGVGRELLLYTGIQEGNEGAQEAFTRGFVRKLYDNERAKRYDENQKFDRLTKYLSNLDRENPQDSEKIYESVLDFFNAIDEDRFDSFRSRLYDEGFDVTGLQLGKRLKKPEMDYDIDEGVVTAPSYFSLYYYFRKVGYDIPDATEVAQFYYELYKKEKELLEGTNL